MTAEVVIEQQFKYQELAPEFRQMHKKGMSINAMASVKGMTWGEAKTCFDYAVYGKRPAWNKKAKKKKQSDGSPKPVYKYKENRSEVTRRRDVQGKSFNRISAELGIGLSTTTRSFDDGHPEIVAAARESGTTPNRGRVRQIPKETIDKVHRMLAERRPVSEIASETGVGDSTVRREMVRLGIKYPKKVKRKQEPRIKRRPGKDPKKISSIVVKMIDGDGLTQSEVMRRLRVTFRTVEKAYDFGRPDLVAAAVASGEPIRRATNSRLGQQRKKQIRVMVERAEPIKKIMEVAGCSNGTAMRARLKYVDELISKSRPGTSASEIAEKTGCREAIVQRMINRCA